MTAAKRLAPRGGPVTTAYAHELGLHCYPWPKLLGEDRAKWERLALLVDKAARHEHQRACTGSPDGRSRHRLPYDEQHAANHRIWAETHLVAFVEAGIPAFLAEQNEPEDAA